MDLKNEFWDDIYSLENEEKPYSLYCLRLAQDRKAEEMRIEVERCVNRLEAILGDSGIRIWIERTVSKDAVHQVGKNIKKAILDLKKIYDDYVLKFPTAKNGDKRAFDYGYLAFLAMNTLFIGEQLNAERQKIDERGDAWYCATDFLFSRDYVIAAYDELDYRYLHQDIIPSHFFNLYEREALRLFLSERYGKEFEFLWKDIAKEMLGNKTIGELKKKTCEKYYSKGIEPTMVAYSFTYALIFMATMEA